jgi:hypothetical protein
MDGIPQRINTAAKKQRQEELSDTLHLKDKWFWIFGLQRTGRFSHFYYSSSRVGGSEIRHCTFDVG